MLHDVANTVKARVTLVQQANEETIERSNTGRRKRATQRPALVRRRIYANLSGKQDCCKLKGWGNLDDEIIAGLGALVLVVQY